MCLCACLGKKPEEGEDGKVCVAHTPGWQALKATSNLRGTDNDIEKAANQRQGHRPNSCECEARRATQLSTREDSLHTTTLAASTKYTLLSRGVPDAGCGC
jgi:hypothetical protein